MTEQNTNSISHAEWNAKDLAEWLTEEAKWYDSSDKQNEVLHAAASLLQQQQEQVKRLKDELADERMRLSACLKIAVCDTPETAIRARNEYREHYWGPAAEAIAQKIDELIRLRKRFSEEAESWRRIAEQIELFYSRQTNAVEALKRLRQWGRLCGYSYNSDVVLGVVDWIDGGMVGELPPLPSHALPQPQGEVK